MMSFTSRETMGRYALALIWTGLLIAFSSNLFSSGQTGGLLGHLLASIGLPLDTESLEGLHHYLRKAGHFSAYALLAWLWDRVYELRDQRWSYTRAFVICVLIAGWDEANQSLLSDRTGSLADVALDLSGASLLLLSRKILTHARTGKKQPQRVG